MNREKISFAAIPAAGVHGVGFKKLPGNLLKLSRGYIQARKVIQGFKPNVMFFTGGYVAVPVAIAGRTIRTVLYVPDIEPGMALKTLARFADCIVLTTSASQEYFPDHHGVQISGYPIRKDLRKWNRQEACQILDLDFSLPVLLVLGGSSGARSINRALLAILPELLPHMQVVHICGSLDWEEVSEARLQLSRNAQTSLYMGCYKVFPYLHEEIGAAFAAADLVVSRAGASTLGEYPLFELPAVLVPYPYAWKYQSVNANYLADRGAAVIIEDSELSSRLLPEVTRLMNDPEKRSEMRKAMHQVAQPEAAQSIAKILLEQVEKKNGEYLQ